jgi:hypothetical protein
MRKEISMARTFSRFATCGLVMAAIVVAAPTSGEEEQAIRERYTARAVSMGTSNPPVIPPGKTAVLDINVTRWTTAEERDFLLTELAEGGQQALTRALRKQKETGWIRVTGPRQGGGTSTFPSERLRYARQIVAESGERRLILGLDRPISMYETRNRPRWRNHDVTLMVIDLDAEGNGQGQLAIGVQLALNAETSTLTIENFGTEPVRLTSVSRQK